ncbi:VOC family protein [Galbibacter sp. PAP.153]|uniref:VOC family protein n=1 Tax=Galbibacter sp. PAP.153 TaxID=3104623 RepID=UPI00300935FD
MAVINPYLTFKGNCEEAFNHYKKIFGGEFSYLGRFEEMPAEEGFELTDSQKQKIMHICLPLGNGTLLMGSDSGDWAPKLTTGNNIAISIRVKSKEEADKLFNGLAKGGQVTMPIENVFWGDYFGMCVDKFDINWMVSFNPEHIVEQ